VVSDWTRAPIEDGVDGTGVYASRLRSRRSARGPQSPKVLSLVEPTFGAISNSEDDSTQHTDSFLQFFEKPFSLFGMFDWVDSRVFSGRAGLCRGTTRSMKFWRMVPPDESVMGIFFESGRSNG
jgi:hypothetical protein